MKINIPTVLSVLLVFILIPPHTKQRLPEDATLNFTALGHKYGHDVEEHDVTTEDGYILKLFHIKGDKNQPVLLMHGILDSADTFIVRGNNSLAITLARAGYDVWAGNTRGVPYSRRHIKLDPGSNAFWNFSYHEMGYYDLPAIIDYILNTNGVQELNAIGHSQGNTIFYVLGSMRPEYNDKIKILAALGPVCYLSNLTPPLNTLAEIGALLNAILIAFNTEEVFDESLRMFIREWCTESVDRIRVCLQFFFEFSGYDDEEFEPKFFAVAIGHYPKSTSRKNALHILQNTRGKTFSQYDYGGRNVEMYNSTTPPEYNLGKVTMKVALFAGRNDKLTPLENVEKLAKTLPNVVEHTIMKREKFNHIDHIWGKRMHKYLFPLLLTLLEKHK